MTSYEVHSSHVEAVQLLIFSRKNMGVASPLAHVQRASCSWLEARVSSRVHYKVGASKMERMFREGIGWDGWRWCWFLDFLCSITFQFDPIISSYSQIFAVFSWQPKIQKFFSAREPCLVDTCFFSSAFQLFRVSGWRLTNMFFRASHAVLLEYLNN